MTSPPEFNDAGLTLIELSNICNLKCAYCANQTSQRPRGRMTILRLVDILHQLLAEHGERAKTFRICLHGFGEPTINPLLPQALSILSKTGFTNVDFATNGMELHRAVEAIAMAKCLSWVRISIQSCRQDVMEAMNDGADFHQVIDNTRKLIAHRPHCRVVLQHLISPANTTESEKEFRDAIDCEGWEYMRKRLHTQCGQAPGGPALESLGCPDAYGSRLIIHWDGDLVGCCSDNTKQQVYGNAFTGRIYSKDTLAARRAAMEDFNSGRLMELPLCRVCLK